MESSNSFALILAITSEHPPPNAKLTAKGSKGADCSKCRWHKQAMQLSESADPSQEWCQFVAPFDGSLAQ